MTVRPMTILSIVMIVLCSTFTASAQDEERRVWDTEFLKKRAGARPAADTAGSNRTASAKKRPVNYRRVAPKPANEQRVAQLAATKPEPQTVGEMIGVTIWRLRPSTARDSSDARLLIPEGNDETEWIPERVEAGAIFAAGDRLRLSVESPRDGYLYVINREQYAGGQTSDPYLIFPTLRMRNGDNRLTAGKVITIPDRKAFRLTPSRDGYKGEVLMLLITKEPLSEIKVGPSIVKLDRAQLAQWEEQWTVAAERFEMTGGAGQAWTKVEQESEQEGSRILTQEDEMPQTLLRVVVKAGQPILIVLPLLIGK